MTSVVDLHLKNLFQDRSCPYNDKIFVEMLLSVTPPFGFQENEKMPYR